MLQSLIFQKKNSSIPMRPSMHQIRQVRSEPDQTPYPGFFRGGIGCAPIVFNRRAGWTPQFSPIPRFEPDEIVEYCWQAPCNTVFTMEKKDGKCQMKKCINL